VVLPSFHDLFAQPFVSRGGRHFGRGTQLRSFTVLTDLEGYRSSLADAGAIGVGRNYDLIPIRVERGVFHPKIAIMVQVGWSAAWSTIVSTTTPWAMAKALETALRSGATLILPAGVTNEESEILHAVASGKTRADRVVILQARRKGEAACPACNYLLPAIQRGRLHSIRVATCDYFRCHRLMIDISF
jgi:hypothetical protein